MDKDINHLIILWTFIAILLMAGFAYMQHQGTQNNNMTPLPTVTPTPGSTTLPMATLFPGLAITPAATGALTATPVQIQPTVTTAPTLPAYISPMPVYGWPPYNARYGPTRLTGTITAIVKDEYDNPVEGQSIGVLRGSYSTITGASKVAARMGKIDATTTGPEIPVPTKWVTTDANGSAFLGDFAYGNYTVYNRIVVPDDGYCYKTETIAIGEEHKNWIVNFDLLIIDYRVSPEAG